MKKMLLLLFRQSAIRVVSLLLVISSLSVYGQNAVQPTNGDDNPNLDRIPQWYLNQQQNSVKSPSVVVTVNDYDNFYLGTDFAEGHISVDPTEDGDFFTAFNTDHTHRTSDGHDWVDGTAVSWGTTIRGDVVTAYDASGRLYYENMYGSSVAGCKIAKSYNNGSSWYTPVTAISGVDKNWMAVDQSTPGANAPYAGYVYTVMTAGGGSGNFARSTNYGASFTTTFTPSTQSLPGMMVCVGAYGSTDGGAVYVVTNSGSSFASTYTFYVSINGGSSFNYRGSQNFAGYVGTNVNGRNSVENMRTRPYPFIAADNSDGPYRERLYLVYASNYPSGNGNKPNIYCRYSTDYGLNWSSAVKVNDDSWSANNNWAPAIWCDSQTGRLYVHWMDTRDDTSGDDEAFMYATYSDNGGTSFVSNQKLSNEKMTINCTTCGGGGTPRYQGDYTSIVSYGGVSVSSWADYRDGTFASYTGYFPDYAMALSVPTKAADDIFAVNAEVPDVKLYTDDVTFTATMETPPSGSFSISYPSGNTLSTFPGSIPISITSNAVPSGTYTLTVVGKGPGGIPIHERQVDLDVTGPNYWTGNFNSYWGNGTNWSLGHVPTALEDVVIPNVNMPCIVDYSDKTCHNITIEAGATVQIEDQSLDVNYDADVYGSFELLNTASRLNITHNIRWQSGSTASMTGSATIKVLEDWDFISGANVIFTAGYVEFAGTLTSWIRSYDPNCRIKYLRNSKTGGGSLGFSALSTNNLVITSNIYNYSGAIFNCYSSLELEMGGFFNNMDGHINCYDGTVNFTGYPSVALKPNVGDYFNNLTMSGAGTLSLDNTYSNELQVNGDLSIEGGTLSANAFDIHLGGNWTNTVGSSGFNEGTSRVIFDGPGPEMQYINSSETFNIIENAAVNAIRVNSASVDVICNSYDWTSSGVSVYQGSFTALDLADNSLYGSFWALSGSQIILYQDAGNYIDLKGNLYVVNNGLIEVHGGADRSYWASGVTNSVNVESGGVLDFVDWGIRIYDSGTLNETITGGSIRLGGGFECYRTDFNPAGGEIELYGGTDANISVTAGSNFYDLLINKTGGDKSLTQYVDRDGEAIKAVMGNTATLISDIYVANNLTLSDGSMLLNGNTATVDGDCNINATLDVGATGNVLNHGVFNLGSTGTLSISGGSFVNDNAYYTSKAWQDLNGTLNLSSGLFEIMHNSIWLGADFVDNISGGIIRTGMTFRAQTAGTFEPSGGVVELTGSGTTGPSIHCQAGNYFNDLEIKSTLYYYVLYSNIEVKGDFTIDDNGLLVFNNYDVSCFGNVTVNGMLYIDDDASLLLDDGSTLNVNSGGELDVEGTIGHQARVSHIASGYYAFNINSGAVMGADYAIFEFMDGNGVYLKAGSVVAPGNTFNYCVFRNGHAAPSALLALNNSSVFTSTGAYFENTSGTTGYNVWKYYDSGDATFEAATGDFAGPEFEYDPYDHVQWTDVYVSTDLTLMLDGPYNGTVMNTELNNLGLIPLNQPFNSNPSADWYYTGTESVAAVPANVVDWVLVQLRDANSASAAGAGTVVSERAAFLLADGSIVDLDGFGNLNFAGVTYTYGLYPVVWQRNHLGIISSVNMTRSAGVFTYDFTQAGSAYSNTEPGEINLGGGVWGMFGGDSNGSGWIYDGDMSINWSPFAGETGYQSADCNLDGQVDNKDKNDVWFNGYNMHSQIPGSKKKE